MQHALELFSGRERLFVSDSKWIYPLFELEEYLRTAGLRPESLQVRDRVVGRAAALVQVYLGLGSVHAGLLSEGGRSVLEVHGVPVTFDRLVDVIGCQTEVILADELTPERAYRTLRRRAGLDGLESQSGTGDGIGIGTRDRGGSERGRLEEDA